MKIQKKKYQNLAYHPPKSAYQKNSLYFTRLIKKMNKNKRRNSFYLSPKKNHLILSKNIKRIGVKSYCKQIF